PRFSRDWSSDVCSSDLPPLSIFPWVEHAEGRTEHVGAPIECGRCVTREWPDGFEPYKATKIFDQDSTPAGLLADHQTRAGVWGRDRKSTRLNSSHVKIS